MINNSNTIRNNRSVFKWLLAVVFAFLISGLADAQVKVYTSTNKGAIRAYEQATKYYDARDNDKAQKELESAINKDPGFVEAYILLADVYVDKSQYELAIDQYKKATDLKPDFFTNSWYRLAQIELNIGRYADAKVHFNKYLSYPRIPENLKLKSERALVNCDFAITAIEHPVEFKPENLGAGVNTDADEYYPSLTIDGKTLVFTRNKKDPEQRNMPQEDFYVSNFKDGAWSMAFNAGGPLNTSQNEGAPSISADGKLLFFAACDREGGAGSCDIYFSRNVNGRWSAARNLGEPINTKAWETQPSFSSDGKTLYFVRGFHTNEGIKQQDIYVTSIGANGNFQTPVKLGSNINSDEAEESVFIHPDNQTLYFSSRGFAGMGGLDIYLSKRQEDGSWGKAVNLGYPINTCNDENSLLVSPDGVKAYFATNREGGFGGLDLYQFNLPASAQPQKITYVRGHVTDAVTDNPLGAGYEIIEIETGKTIVSGNADKASGNFTNSLTVGKDYLLNVSHPGYLFYSDHFSCKEAVDFSNPFLLEIKLQAATVGNKVILKNIFFDTDSFNLKPQSNIELEKLVQLLTKNPKIKIQISGHTDNTGDPKKNMILSDNRAKAVYTFLIAKGIDKTRLTYKGFGDTQPIAPNTTAEGRAQNRRTEFVIVSTE